MSSKVSQQGSQKALGIEESTVSSVSLPAQQQMWQYAGDLQRVLKS
jgi:hypothetical protein